MSTPAFQFKDVVRDGETRMRYAAVLGLQMGQFLPVSFIGLMLPIIFREQGLPLEQMFLFAIPSIPTWLRPLWAAWVDRTGSATFGRRRSWFVPCTIAAACAYLLLSNVEPTLANVYWMIALLTVTNTIITTQDIAIDGYMVENIADHERPVGGALLDIARNIGMFLAWGGLGLVYREFGWTAATGGAATLLILFSLPGMLRREPPPTASQGPPPSFKRLITRRDNHLVLPLCFVAALLGSLLPVLFPTFLIDRGYSAGDVALIAGPATLIGTLLGATVASLVLRRLGYRATFAIAACGVALAILPVIWLTSVEAPTVAVVFLVTLNGLALPSLFDVAFQAARLKWASRAQAATDYTAQIVVMRAGSSLATALGGLLAGTFGWTVYFSIAGIAVVSICIGMWALFDTVERLVDARARSEQAQEAPRPSLTSNANATSPSSH